MCRNKRLIVISSLVILVGCVGPAAMAQGPVKAGLVFWLDASKTNSVVLSGDKVTRWDDLSGNNYYADQTDAALQPTYLSGALSGRAIVDFGDSIYGATTQPWMQFRDASGTALNISTIRTVFWVCGMDAGSNGFLLGDDNNYHFHRGQQNQIWDGANGWASANIRSGSTYLNGVQVDGTATVLPTDYSIVSLVTTANVEASMLTRDRTYRSGGIKLGELLIYDRALTDDERRGVESYLYGKWFVPGTATEPQPEDGAIDIPRETTLSWTAGEFAAAHDVYFGMAFDDVNGASRGNPMGVLVSQSQTATNYDPAGVLDFSQTYYWRVDEVNAAPDNTIFKGTVWSFTTEPLAYPIAGVIATSNGTSDTVSTPQRTVDGSGINANDQASTNSTDMWLATAPAGEALYIQYEFDRIYKLHELLVWNYNVQFEPVLGFGIKDVTVEYSVDGREWITLGDAQFARATATTTYTANTTVDLGGVAAQFVRLNINSGWGMLGQYGLSEVRFTSIPVQAREPEPADGAADVDPDSALSWRAGRDAVSHDVYLGTDPDGLSLIDNTGDTTVTPGMLEFGTTYYWRVDETVDALWTGDLWSFSTKQYELIDGFETYTDDIEAGEAIFDTWIDGWVNDNGSTVGYFDAPFAEKTIVHSGRQSMPLQYDNAASPFYSEAERTFNSPQDWTGNGADTLVLYVRGNAPDFVEAADGSIVMSAIGTDIWDVSDQFRYAYKNLSGDGSMTVRVDSIIRSNEWAKAGVMIRETLEPGSKHAFAAATPEPSHGLSFQRRPVAGQASANTDVADINLPEWVRLTRTGNIFTMAYSNDGVTWTDVVASPAVDIQMNANVYIGLALCSHDAAIVTAAEMSNVSTTGNVSGAWQLAEIGVAQPMGNAAEPMYVRIEDSAGKTKTVVNADVAITARPSWQEWAIPYSDLAGLELSRVEKMYIGVGSKTTPKAGGAGIVYVDDIGYGRTTVE